MNYFNKRIVWFYFILVGYVVKSDFQSEISEYENRHLLLNQLNIKNEIIKLQADILSQAVITTIYNSGQYSLQNLIIGAYGQNITNSIKIIKFLNSLSNIEDTIQGYRFLFDEIILNGHEYSATTTTIAYIINIFEKLDHGRFKQNENVIHILNHLPESLKQLPWYIPVHIKNYKTNETIIQKNVTFDSLIMRYPCTFRGGLCFYGICKWIITSDTYGFNFHISNKEYSNDYLYVDTLANPLDSVRRRVYSSSMNETINTNRWQLEPVNGTNSVKIKNVFWNEYLYSEDGFIVVGYPKFRHLFTNRLGECNDDRCLWNISKATNTN